MSEKLKLVRTHGIYFRLKSTPNKVTWGRYFPQLHGPPGDGQVLPLLVDGGGHNDFEGLASRLSSYPCCIYMLHQLQRLHAASVSLLTNSAMDSM